VNPRGSHDLRAQADWCRTLANATFDLPTRGILTQTAAEFDAEAKAADAADAAMALTATADASEGAI
jgi:hypothetical protein